MCEVLMKNLEIRFVAVSCQNWPLSRLADLCLKIPQEAISRINSRSYHYTVTLFIKQYNKRVEWI